MHRAAFLIALLLAGPALAEDAPKSKPLTVDQAIQVASGLAQLDGYDKVIGDGQQQRVVHVFYQFGGGLRWQIAQSIATLRPIVQAYQQANNELIFSLAGGNRNVPDDKAQAYNAETRKMLDADSGVSLPMIRKSELKTDENPLPGGVLTLLIPIIDPEH